MLFSLIGEIMEKVKTAQSRAFVPAAEWVRRLAEETAAFEIVNAVEEKAKRTDQRKVEWDQVITISVKPDQRRVDLLVQTRQHLLPNTVLGIFQKLNADRPDGTPLLCTPYISPRVAEMCREQNVGYLDGVGNCWIAAPGLFVHVAGRSNRPTVSKAVDPFSKKSSRIVRTLLTHPQQGWQVQQLAQQADVSLGLVWKAKTALVEDAYLEERNRLLFVRDGVKLLQGWSAEYRPHVKRVQLFAIPRPNEIEKRLAEWCRTNKVTYALTQLAAAWRYSPMVRYDKSVAYIDRKLETGNKLKSLLEQLDAKEVETGANCILWITDDPAVFTDSKEIDGVMVVSPLQLYLDLMALSGRGKDAAEEVFERELRPLLTAGESKSGGDE
ncbi:MAG: type IV toxin-antitoxin system AbiEi family antitoxin [Pirellulales bacterium]